MTLAGCTQDVAARPTSLSLSMLLRTTWRGAGWASVFPNAWATRWYAPLFADGYARPFAPRKIGFPTDTTSFASCALCSRIACLNSRMCLWMSFEQPFDVEAGERTRPESLGLLEADLDQFRIGRANDPAESRRRCDSAEPIGSGMERPNNDVAAACGSEYCM